MPSAPASKRALSGVLAADCNKVESPKVTSFGKWGLCCGPARGA